MNEVIQRNCIDLLYRQSYAVLFANFVIPWPVAYIFRGAVSTQAVLGWVAVMYGLTVWRILLARRYFARANDVSLAPGPWGWQASLLS